MKGLDNIGNTCYLNSGLQMVVQNKDLCNLIMRYSDKSEILKTLADFITEYYNTDGGTNGSISPYKIKRLVEERCNIFIGYGQQDSTEFILYLLDIIDNEITNVNKDCKELKTLFGVELNIRIKCKLKTCLSIYNNKEVTNVLMLDIKNDSKNLDDVYNNIKSSDKLEADNKYFCEKCQAKRIASKRTSVTTWPDHLFIWLKRFSQSGRHIIKNNNRISVPLVWRDEYDLQGAVCHSGNLNGGHYIYVGKVNDKWFMFNDSSVVEIRTNDELLSIVGGAYWLYYKKFIKKLFYY